MINLLKKYTYLLLVLLWVFLSMYPWFIWLDSFPWIRLALAVVIFISPGLIISLMLAGDRLTPSSHVVSGMAISIFLVGVLGLSGRAFHLPFDFIKPAFSIIGFFLISSIAIYIRRGYSLYSPQKANTLTVVLFIVIFMFAVMKSIGQEIGEDDFSYMAYLTHWRYASQLDFTEPIFGTGSIDMVRFWLAMFPMIQAFLADLSNLSGILLLGYYLEPFLVFIALLSLYNLYSKFLTGAYLPIAALLLHVSFLFMLQQQRQPGLMFFIRLSEDKVFAAFALAPAFFLAVCYLFESITLRSIVFALISGWGLALTHPIILAYSVAISGLYIFFKTVLAKEYKKVFIIAFVLLAIMLPPASLRFVESSWVSRIFDLNEIVKQPGSFDLETVQSTPEAETLITYIEDSPFYGFNLDRVKIFWDGGKAIEKKPLKKFFSYSFLWVLGFSFLWSLFYIQKNQTAAFIAAGALLVLACAVPYTGWLVGYLVSARMLWRAPWLFPIGAAGVILIHEAIAFILQHCTLRRKIFFSSEAYALGLVILFSTASLFYTTPWSRLSDLTMARKRLQTFSNLGTYLESNVESSAIFAAPRTFSDYLPGISSKSKVVFFRYEERNEHFAIDLDEFNLLFSNKDSVHIDQRINILKKYHIQYILVDERATEKYYSKYPYSFAVTRFKSFSLIKFLDQ